MKRLAAAFFALLVAPSAHAVDFESDAIVRDDERKMGSAIGSMLDTTGYDCKTISNFRPFFLEPGFLIQCNQYMRKYNIRPSNSGERMWDIEVVR